MYKHKRNQMNPAQRSFFDDLFSTTRRSHKTFVFEAKGTRVNFDALRPLLGFLSQSQVSLVVCTFFGILSHDLLPRSS